MTRRHKLALLLLLTASVLLIILLTPTSRLSRPLHDQGGQTRNSSDRQTSDVTAQEPLAPEPKIPEIPGSELASGPAPALAQENKIVDLKIQGHIVNERGGAVDTSTVRVCELDMSGECAYRGSTTSDPNGYYQLMLRAGAEMFLKILAEKPGFAAEEGSVRTRSGEVVEMNFVLRQTRAWIKGRVTATDGHPVPGASAYVFEPAADKLRRSPTGYSQVNPLHREVECQPDGGFILPDLPLIRVSVSASAKGFRPAVPPREIELQAGENRVEVQLTSAGVFSLLVKNHRNEPIPRATALAAGSKQVYRFKADSQGLIQARFGLDRVEQSEFEVHAAGYRSQTVEMISARPFREVVLDDGRMLRGRVVAGNGQGIPGAGVLAQAYVVKNGQARGLAAGNGMTDAHGRFEIGVALDRDLQIRAGHPQYLNRTEWLESLDDRPEVTIVLRKPEAALHGTVVDADGKPVTECEVDITEAQAVPASATDPLAWYRARVGFEASEHVFNTLGRFEFPAVPAGVLEITVVPPGPVIKSERIVIRAGVDNEVNIKLDPEPPQP